MKKIILSLIAVVAMVMFSGCAGGQPQSGEVGKYGETYRIVHIDDNIFEISIRGIVMERNNLEDYKKHLRLAINKAAKTSKEKGYTKFVVANVGVVNNLEGSPINTYSELERLVSLKLRKPSFATNGSNMNRGLRRLLNGRKVLLNFKPVNNEYDGTYISTWDVEQTLRDTK